MINRKVLPYSRTMVLDYKAVIVDSTARSKVMNGSFAAPILDADPFNSIDANALDTQPLVIQNVKSFLFVECYDEFVLEITQAGVVLSQTCKGVFLYTGTIEQVRLFPKTGATSVRIKYTCT